MKDNGINQPPDSKIPTVEELRLFAGQSVNFLRKVIKQLEPASEQKEIILLGLFTKELKTYINALKIADLGDSDTPPILARIIYEISLSIAYILLKGDEKPGILDDFKKTSQQRVAQTLKDMEGFKSSTRKSAVDTIVSIKRKLTSEGYDFEEPILSHPKSWLSDVSYYQMAKTVGGLYLEMYSVFYGLTSIFIHPNWSELEVNHLTKNPDKKYTSKNVTPNLSVHPLVSATCLILISIEMYTMKYSEKNRRNIKLVKMIREIHYLIHNGSPKPPFFSYC